MSLNSRRPRPILFLFLIGILFSPLWLTAGGQPARAAVPRQESPTPFLIPIGGGHAEIFDGFSAAAVANHRSGYVNILVLPVAYAASPEAISDAERRAILSQAEEQRSQIDEACKLAAPSGMVCSTVVAPILTRSDALDPAVGDYFSTDLSAVIILGDDQATAMQVINGTPVEVALTQAYENGVIIAGASAGGNMLSAAMLSGYQEGFSAANALNFGAVDLWNSAEKHGLPFGLRTAVLDQSIFQRGRVGRLLNAITDPASPHVGVGVDSYTGVLVPAGERLEGVFGLYTVAIFDGETYQASRNVSYKGCGESGPVLPCTPLLSLRNILVHLLAPGAFSYDLNTRQHSLAAPVGLLRREFQALRLPSGAGPLLLSGSLDFSQPDNPVLSRFRTLAEAHGGRVLIFVDGYPDLDSTQRASQLARSSLQFPGPGVTLDPSAASQPTIPDLKDFDAVLVLALDQSSLHPQFAGWLPQALEQGKPVLMVGAASAMAGPHYIASPPPPPGGEPRDLALQRAFIQGDIQMRPGIGLLDITVEPDVMLDDRWGRLFALAYNFNDQITVGLNPNTAVEISSSGASALGDNAALVLDLRTATLELGDNQAFVIANGLLDVFGPGDQLAPEIAYQGSVGHPRPTPALISATPTITASPTITPSPTPAPTGTPTPRPTRTPRPTLTPPIIPPPTNPNISHWMVAFGMLIVVVILFGLMLNRQRMR